MVVYWDSLLHYHVARIRALYTLGEELGHSVHAFALRPGSPGIPVSGYQHLFEHIEVLNDDACSAGVNSKSSACRLMKRLDEISPDAVAILGYDNRVALKALKWCRQNRRGAVLLTASQERDYRRFWWREWLKRQLVACFDAAMVGGKPHVSYAKKLGFSAKQIFTTYNVVDNDFWADWSKRVRKHPGEWRQRLDLPERFFVTASRFVRKKNIEGMLRAHAAYVRMVGPGSWPLLIIGDGPLVDELKALTLQLGLSGLVRFTGYLPAHEMAPMFALASAFVLASSHSEQWGLVVNEAMASGIPVIVSQICGCATDLVVDGETGFTFDPQDESELATLLAYVSDGAVDLVAMGCAAQRRIEQFSPQVFAASLVAAGESAGDRARSRKVSAGCWFFPTIVASLIR
jgi:glycosyltransferase involved in cell wall biosynthesis